MTGIFNDFSGNWEVDIMVAKHVFHEISRVIRQMTIISCRVPYGEVYLCLTGNFPLNLDGKLSIRICGCRLYL